MSVRFSCYFVIKSTAKVKPNILKGKCFIQYTVEIIIFIKSNVFTKKSGICGFGW